MKKNQNRKSVESDFVIRTFKKHITSHILALLIYVLTAVLNLLVAYIMMQIIDKVIVYDQFKKLIFLLACYLIASTILNIFNVTLEYIYSKIGKKILIDLRFSVMKSLFKLNGKSLTELNTGLMLSIMHSDIPLLESVLTKMFPTIITSVITSLGFVTLLAFVQPLLLVVILAFEIVAFLIQKRIGNKVKKVNENFVEFNTKSYSILQELFSNVKNIIIMKGVKFFTHKFLTNERKLIISDMKLEISQSASSAISNEFNSLINFMILGLGGYMILNNHITIGGLIMFLNYAGRLLSPIDIISRSYIDYQQARISIVRILNFIDTSNENIYKGIKKKDIVGNINMNNVSFAYNENTILKNIKLSALNGKITSFVGASGSGKTTLVNLIMRFWDTTEGDLTIDGINIKNYNLAFLRSRIAVVSQDVVMFDDTILNNLVLNHKIDMNKVVECLKRSDAYDFIMGLPNKYDTMIGEKGVTLSGGQKQKLALARALLLDCPIIIFDEVTASLDNDSSDKIENTILDMSYNKTIIFITHKLTISKLSDIIYVLENGHIVENGTHDDLLLLKGVYSHLYYLK